MKEEQDKKVDSEEEEALAIRDAKAGKKENPEAIVARLEARQSTHKQKWIQNKKSIHDLQRRQSLIAKTGTVNVHSLNLLRQASIKKKIVPLSAV